MSRKTIAFCAPLRAMWRPCPSWTVFAASLQSRLALSLSSFPTELAPYNFDIKIQLPIISRLFHSLFCILCLECMFVDLPYLELVHCSQRYDYIFFPCSTLANHVIHKFSPRDFNLTLFQGKNYF